MKLTISLSVIILVLAGPVLGSSIHGEILNKFRIKTPKADCGLWDLFDPLGIIQLKVQEELDAGAQAAKDIVGNNPDFDTAIDKMVDHSYNTFVAHFNIFYFLQIDHPYDLCEYSSFGYSLWARDAEISVEQASRDIASLAYLKSPEHYEMVLADFAPRIEVIKQDIHDAEEVVRGCREYFC